MADQPDSDQNAANPGGRAWDDYEVRNELEFLIEGGRDKKVSLGTIFQTLLRANVWVLLNKKLDDEESRDDVQGLMVQDDDGTRMMTIFTHEECTREMAQSRPEYGYPNSLSARLVLDQMEDDMGLVINPGHPLSVRVTPEGVRDLKRVFGPGWLQRIPDPEQYGESRDAPIPGNGAPS